MLKTALARRLGLEGEDADHARAGDSVRSRRPRDADDHGSRPALHVTECRGLAIAAQEDRRPSTLARVAAWQDRTASCSATEETSVPPFSTTGTWNVCPRPLAFQGTLRASWRCGRSLRVQQSGQELPRQVLAQC